MSEVLKHADYTVAWIAILPIEVEAALGVLDRRHNGYFESVRGDDYTYIGGEINGHNIVIAKLPAGQNYGVGAAAALVNQVKARFENIWFALLVGVAAGLPMLSISDPDRYRDIRLGDVLVCIPDKSSTGIIHYDLGQETSHGFKANGRQAEPPALVRAAIGDIQLIQKPFLVGNDLALLLENFSRIVNDDRFDHPGQEQDQLFERQFFLFDRVVDRQPRDDSERTKVWYGNIGSGNTLMKNAKRRNELRDQHNLIGLEMEAAGVMNTLPTGVVRGVCDYGDSHKTERWQPYAAAVAAVYAKAILQRIHPKVPNSERIALKAEPELLREYEVVLHNTLRSNFEFLCFSPAEDAYEGTCSWLLDHPVYNNWLTRKKPNSVWVCGPPGSGKTVISRYVLRHWQRSSNNSYNIAFFYFSRQAQRTISPVNFLSALLHQILQQYSLTALFLKEFPSSGSLQSLVTMINSEEGLWTVLDQVLRILQLHSLRNPQKPLLCVIDAIEECIDGPNNRFLRCLWRFLRLSPFSISAFITCRQDYLERNRHIISPEHVVYLGRENSLDIQRYVTSHLRSRFRDAVDSGKLTRLEHIIVNRSEGIFVWVVLAIEALIQGSSRLDYVTNTINSFPKSHGNKLKDLYEAILRQASNDLQDEDLILDMRSMFGPVILAARPLSIQELQQYLDVDNKTHHRLDIVSDIERTCRGLLKIEDGHVKPFHPTLTTYLLDPVECLSQFHIDRDEGHARFAEICLRHTIESDAFVFSDRAQDVTVAINQHAFRSYAACQWPYHTKLSSSQRHVLVRLIRTLLGIEQSFRKWYSYVISYDSHLQRELQFFSTMHASGADLSAINPGPAHILSLLGFESSFFQEVFRGNEIHSLSMQALSANNKDDNHMIPAHWAAGSSGLHLDEKALELELMATAISYAVQWDKFIDGPQILFYILKEFPGSAQVPDASGRIPLHIACASGNLAKVQILLNVESNINHQDQDNSTPLHSCCSWHTMDVAGLLISHGANVNISDSKGDLPLHVAARCGVERTIKLLIDSKADINAQNGYGMTPLHCAILFEIGDGQTVLTRGLNALDGGRQGSDDDISSSFFATIAARESSIQRLIAAGSDLERRTNDEHTALTLAALLGHLKIVKLLTACKANVNAAAKDEMTPLHYAAFSYSGEMTQVLIEANAETTCRNDDGATPLHLASQMAHIDTVKTLIRAGANVNAADFKNSTPLHGAVQTNLDHLELDLHQCESEIVRYVRMGLSGRELSVRLKAHEEVARSLFNAGANVNATTDSRISPLHYAARDGHAPLVTMLIEFGANVDAMTLDEARPIDVAAMFGNDLCVEILIEHGATVLPDASRGQLTPLHLASMMGHKAVLEVLLETGADVNTVDSSGQTPLHALINHGESSYITPSALESLRHQNNPAETSTLLLHAAQLNRSWGDMEQDQCLCLKLLISHGANLNIVAELGHTALHVAAAMAREAITEILLDNGASIEMPSSSGCTALWSGVYEGSPEVVRTLITRGADINALQMNRFHPLEGAIDLKKYEMAMILIKAGADTNPKRIKELNYASLAAYHGQVDLTKVLIDHGADVRAVNYDGSTALHLASVSGCIDIAKMLLRENVDVDCTESEGYTPLHLAVEHDHLHTVKYLLEAGADVSKTTKNGNSALHLAAKYNRQEMYRFLAVRGADTSLKNDKGNTPLLVAISEGHSAFVKVLLNAGADLSITNIRGRTPVHIAAEYENAEILSLLLEFVSDLNILDNGRDSALHIAAYTGNLATSRLLLEAGANPNLPGGSGMTPVHCAVPLGSVDLIQLMVSHKGSLNSKADLQATVLHFAAIHNRADLCCWFIEQGIDVNSVDISGLTPLLLALKTCHHSVFRELIVAGADTGINASGWITAQHIAAANDQVESLKMLAERGASLEDADFQGYTLLHHAAENNACSTLKFLLQDEHQSPNMYGLMRAGPLHLALYRGHLRAIEILVEAGADIWQIDGYGYSTLDRARLNSAAHAICLKGVNGYFGRVAAAVSLTVWKPLCELLGIGHTRHRTVLASLRELLEIEDLDIKLYNMLGHCLIILGDDENAYMAFKQMFTTDDEDKIVTHMSVCDMCPSGQVIKGRRFICRECPDVDLCESHMSAYMREWCMIRCRQHRFMSIPDVEWSDKVSRVDIEFASILEVRQEWLNRMRSKFLLD